APARERRGHLILRQSGWGTQDAGEHRLPACSFRQLAEKLFRGVALRVQRCRRQAADDCRLAACAPQKKSRTRASCRSPRSPIALFRRMTTSAERPSDFIRDIVVVDVRRGKYKQIRTRFHPEPYGYM